MALGLYGYPNGQRRYLACINPHTLLSTGRLHSERLAFNNLRHMLHYWAHQLFVRAFFANLNELDPTPTDEYRRAEWARVNDETEMVMMLAEGADVSPRIAEIMVERSLSAGRERAVCWVDAHLKDQETPKEEIFYPWFTPGFWGTGDYDADRAADLADLERRLADKLGIPHSQRKFTIELGPGERWY
jgi:hypothetical protein